MRQANSAFISKLGRRVLVDLHPYGRKSLKPNFVIMGTTLTCSRLVIMRPMYGGRGIISSVDVVRKGINMIVGNGTKTFFWHHRWATDKPFIESAITEPPLHIQDSTVKEMWDASLGWKLEMFSSFLPAEVLCKITAHDLIEDEEEVDELFWNGSSSGAFTIASALKIILNESEGSEQRGIRWKELWELNVLQRICFFLWLAIQNRIMTNTNRFIRQMTDDPRCFACGEVEEHKLHILRECLVAIQLWRKLGVDVTALVWHSSLTSWIIENTCNGNWTRLFSITC